MNDPTGLLRRQRAWQRERARLTWGEKVRLAERVRDDIQNWMRDGRGGLRADTLNDGEDSVFGQVP